MNLANLIIVVAPGCPAKLIRELLGAHVLPIRTNFEVLLPSKKNHLYESLTEKPGPSGSARFLPSPSQHFFSLGHFSWLRDKLRFSENKYLLVNNSPYKDPVTALIVLSILAMSRNAITLLFATPEAVVDLTGQGFSERWLVRELNIRVLVEELGRLFWFFKPIFALYFLMFGGLIARKMLSEYLARLSKKGWVRLASFPK